MKKSKAGKAKQRKVVARKPSARKAVRKPAPSAAPAAVAPPQEASSIAPAAPATPTYPCSVLVIKGAEKIPVTVTSEAHHKRLVEEFGERHVEVQP